MKAAPVTLRLTARSALLAIVMAITLAPISRAQDAPATVVESFDAVDKESSDTQDVDAGTSQPDLNNREDFDQPPDTDLETGLPRSVLLTPLRWGRLSLISFTTYEGYNSNPNFQKVAVGATITSMSALAAYSAMFAGWRMNLEYQPFLWLSSKATFKDFAASSVDLRKAHRINGTWHWTASERVRYSPTHATTQQTGFVFDPSGGITIGNAFLSSSRNILVNGGNWVVTNHYAENSSLAFHVSHDFIRLSSHVGSADGLAAEEAFSYSAGATWRKHYSQRNTLSLKYVFRAQDSLGAGVSNVHAQTASIGWSHELSRATVFSATFGPGWSAFTGSDRPNAANHGRATLHGSMTLSKQFYRGGVVLAFARSNGFSGVISDNFNNRYDVAVRQDLTSRWHCSATASYLQQQATGRPGTAGKLASSEMNYSLTRNWTIFAQVRYLDIVGSQRTFAPEKTAILGFRWAWAPDKP